MDFQSILVGVIIVGAIFFVNRSLLRKRRSFSTNKDCGADCGCNEGDK